MNPWIQLKQHRTSECGTSGEASVLVSNVQTTASKSRAHAVDETPIAHFHPLTISPNRRPRPRRGIRSALPLRSLRLIVVPEPILIFAFLDFGSATERRCSSEGYSTLQTFATSLVGVGIPPLRIFAPGSPMPSQSRSSGGIRLVPETNTQKFSGPGTYYKTFAGIKLAPLERN